MLRLAFLLVACVAVVPVARAQAPIPAESRQLVVVVTPSWAATSGTLWRFERGGAGEAWAPVGAATEVVVGRSGLGWGRGLHGAGAPPRFRGPGKAEGDGRAPAGAFRLTDAFGYAPADSAATGLPYLHATADLECVDDAASPYYNRVLRRDTVDADWTSHEEMRRRDVLYRRGVVVDHNGVHADAARRAGGGSCIFLHVWRGPGSTTAGCTAFDEGALTETMAWLRADAAPVLVQLPAPAYRALRTRWTLPDLP